MKKRLFAALLAILWMHCSAPPLRVRAEEVNPAGFLDPVPAIKVFTYLPIQNGVHCQVQGACTDGRYIWCGLNHRRILARLDTTTWEVETREFSKKDWPCGHINDMTYNPNTNKLYVAAYEQDQPETEGDVAVFDSITMEYEGMIHLKRNGKVMPIEAILYDRDRDRYIVTHPRTAGRINSILDADFHYVGPFFIERRDDDIRGGFDTDGNYIFRAMWDKNGVNYITVYDMDGRFVTRIDTEISGSKLEIEDIMYAGNGGWYLNYAIRDGTGGLFYYARFTPEGDLSILETILGRVPASISLLL